MSDARLRSTCALLIAVTCALMAVACGGGGGGSATAPSAASGRVTFYVAVDGNDGWSGTMSAATVNDGPFRSISRAQAAVRTAIAGGMREDVTVFIRAGDHYLDDEIRFRPEDSGRDGLQVVYRNYPGERPLVHRARRLSGWQPDSGQIYKARVDWAFDMLFENGVRATKARHPNVSTGSRFAYSKTSATVAGAETRRFGFKAEDIPIGAQSGALEIVLWPGGPDGEFSWIQQIFVGNTVDRAAGVVTLGQEAGRTATTAVLPIGAGSRYFVQGARELLDQPGEYWVGGGFVHYWPRQAPIEQQVILAPGASQFPGVFSFRGATADLPVRDIRLEGLGIAYTDRYAPAIELSNAERITVRGNHVFGTGDIAIKLDGASRSNAIEDNWIHDVGGDGINLYGDATLGFPARNWITNNHVHDVGHVRGDANGITLGRTSGNVVAHNRVRDVPRMGLYAWGSVSGPSPVMDNVDNVIEFNDLSDATTDSQDAGVIHVSGIGPGNVIRYNRVHDSDLPFSYGQGIYVDVGSCQVTVTGNVVHDLQKRNPSGIAFAGIQALGDTVRVTNNIVAGNHLSRSEILIGASNGSCTAGTLATRNVQIQRNILADNTVDTFYNFMIQDVDQLGDADRNLFWHATGVYAVGYGYGDSKTTFDSARDLLDQWRTNYGRRFDQNSVTVDPRFVDSTQRDFRLRPDSPAYALGFEDIDHARIGLNAGYPFANAAEALDRVFITTTNSGPSATIRLTSGAREALIVTGRTVTGFLITLPPSAITFGSDQPAVAAVDGQGIVTAGGAGLATITVTATYGSATRSAIVFVATSP